MAKEKLFRQPEHLHTQKSSLPVSPYFATIYRQDLEYISRCILDYPDIETGGDFFGFWNNLGLPVILYITGPGENCHRNSAFFRQDLEFLVGVGNEVYSHFGLQHIGSWHSHHKLSLAVPSAHDCNTMVTAIMKNNLEKFFMILGNITDKGTTTVNGFLFDRQNQTNYAETEWKILKSENVLSSAIESNLKKSLQYHPRTKNARLEDLKLMTGSENTVFMPDFEPESWLGSEKGSKELRVIFEWFSRRYTHARMFVTRSGNLELKADNISIIFNYDFPESFASIEIEGHLLTAEEGRFTYNNENDILEYITAKINSFTIHTIADNQKNT
ncbi:hypothetical protein [Chryseobacterium sp. SL1]|uniref:hypothetical protein n=1 Tax=Chryseobacterium sp. SL1 TaxID=2995159 RepID=UPI00227678E8|nr:hypothetical protein [Chryseobacterium sp. SL1]MCY1660928.1 hypothetical protein [Chryseobacterium sp. SL1]